MGFEPFTATELQTASGLSGGTPLWLYVLAEAEAQHRGEYLGEVDGRIVAEVIFELLRHDPDSILKHRMDSRIGASQRHIWDCRSAGVRRRCLTLQVNGSARSPYCS